MLRKIGFLLAWLVLAPSALGAECKTDGTFQAWLAGFKKEALASGISREAFAAAEPSLVFDQPTINADHQQGVFNQSFLQFSDRMINKYRLSHGQALIKQNKALFERIETQFGVPAPVIVAFWALESDFGQVQGNFPVLKSLATLAYDCRRPDQFRQELMAALKLIQRGDLQPSEMIGSWAGELGPTQFVPTHYLQYGVDFDGDGRVDLPHSTPDALATTANFLKSLGWQAGQPWLENVRVPESMPWEKADLTVQLPRSQWAKWGVTDAGGKPLPADDVKASLLLPMGRLGPAFLAYQNFQVYLQWNQSMVYSTTAAVLATRIAGAPAIARGNDTVTVLSLNEVKDLQRLLAKQGYDVGEIDGKLGSGTRAAVKAVQVKLGLPADGYPDADLLSRLHGA
jgi:lytic murein transglycosylase